MPAPNTKLYKMLEKWRKGKATAKEEAKLTRRGLLFNKKGSRIKNRKYRIHSNPTIGEFMKQNQMIMLAALAAGAYWWFKIRKPTTAIAGIPYGMGIMPSGLGIMPTMGRRR